MVSKEVVISNQVGLHARPATFFIQKANEYKASVWVEKEERPITIIADGSDEEEAVEALTALIASDFAE